MAKKDDGLVAIVDLVEAVEHMNLKNGSARKETVKAGLRSAIQYAAMKRAGFKWMPIENANDRSI